MLEVLTGVALSRRVTLPESEGQGLVRDLGAIKASYDSIFSLHRAIDFDSRGYGDMMSALSGEPTRRETLSMLAEEVKPRNAQVLSFAVELEPNCVQERADVCMDRLKPSLGRLSRDKFRLAVIETALKLDPGSVDPQQLAQTLLHIAERISPVAAALVTADLFLSALMMSEEKNSSAESSK